MTSRDAGTEPRDMYGAQGEEQVATAPAPAPVSQPVVSERYTELPGRYTNASPSGFSNSSAWSRSGATPEVK